MSAMNAAATIQNLARAALRLGYRIEVHGRENVPATGPVVIAANHLGWLDGPMLLLASRRPLRVLAKHELWDSPFSGLMRTGRGIPVDWQHADRTALKTSLDALKQGEALGIFPEGTRCRGDFNWMRDGISYLLSHVSAPVVPAAIFGTRPTGKDRDHIVPPGTQIHIVVGQAIAHGELVGGGDPTRRSTSHEIGRRLQKRLAEHVASAAASYGLQLPDDDVSRPEERKR